MHVPGSQFSKRWVIRGSTNRGAAPRGRAAATPEPMKTSEDRPPGAVTKAVEDAEPRAWYPLALIFAIVALGIFVGGLLSYRSYEGRFRTRIEEQLSAITELKVGQIVRWRRERLADANYIRRPPYATRRALDVLAQPERSKDGRGGHE